jgi:hypothetical protein
MKKMAIFVEGDTELCFVDRLLREIANSKKLQIVQLKGTGGARSLRRFNVVQDSGYSPGKEYYVQIVNSGTDNRVASDVRDSYKNLIQNGYSTIIGIRDLYPIQKTDLNRLRLGLQYKLQTKPVSVIFALGIMEIEAWFLAEHTHFSRIHQGLTCDRIASHMGFDPSNDDMQTRPHPAEDLHNIYSLEGFAYQKKRTQVQRTVDVLDYAEIYLPMRSKFPDISILMQEIDLFFG